MAFIMSSRGTRSAARAKRAGICTAISPPRMNTTTYTCQIWAQPGQRQKRQRQGDHRIAQDAKYQEQLAIHPVGQHAAHECEEQVGDPENADRQTQRRFIPVRS